MKISFLGAAREVTGSCYLIETQTLRFLVDCGMVQGGRESTARNRESFAFDPATIDFVLLTHAHIDHSGRIPKLCKDGFEGDVICTSATRDLASIMLMDSAYIQEKDVVYVNKRRARLGEKPVAPLYQIEDARTCLEQFIGVGYNRWYKINDKISVRFRDSGHILGSASVTLRIKMEGGYDKFIGFTGDIGRPDRPILRDPQPLDDVDYLICESTYGGKQHGGIPDNKQELLNIIRNTCVVKKGKLIIPAFSVGRTQEIVYMLDKLESEGKLPKIPVYVDSPLAVNATDIFTMHPECFDDHILDYMREDPNPFGFNNLKYVRSVNQSKKINDLKGPAIIISASGMMSAGRVKHHLANNIGDSRNTILVVGYCSPGTLGGRIRGGDKEVRIYGVHYKVQAEVEVLDSFSAHGDQQEMLDYLDNLNRGKLKKIFLVHGDLKRQEAFKEGLTDQKFSQIEIPHLGQSYKLEL